MLGGVSDGIPSKPSRKVESADYTAYMDEESRIPEAEFRSKPGLLESAIEVQTRWWQFCLMARDNDDLRKCSASPPKGLKNKAGVGSIEVQNGWCTCALRPCCRAELSRSYDILGLIFHFSR